MSGKGKILVHWQKWPKATHVVSGGAPVPTQASPFLPQLPAQCP